MAVKTNQYAAPLSQDTSRGPSQSIWADCPLEDFIQGFGGGIGTSGYLFQDDFLVAGTPTLNAQSSMGQWSSWADTGSTFIDAGQEGSVLQLVQTTNAKQIVIASNASAFQFATGATNFPLKNKMWFECRVALASITTGIRDFFIGLCDHTSSQITSANNLVVATAGNTLITTKGLFGFHFRDTTNPTDVGVAFNVAGGTVQYPTALQTLSLTVAGAALAPYAAVTNGNATGFIKLGWVFDPTQGNPPKTISTASSGQTVGNVARPLIQFFVNGQLCSVFLTSTNVQAATFPVNPMSLCFILGVVTGSTSAYIDWIRCAQLSSF